MLLTAVICTIPTPARAVGIGPYIDFSGGSGTFEYDSDNYEFDVDTGTGAIGLALDTDPTGRSYFSYRLNIGYERQDLEEDYDITWKMRGLAVENVFAFAVARGPNMRWWVGPLVRFGFYSGDTDDYYYFYSGDRYKSEADLFEFGIGVATGVNIRVSRNLVLAPSAGFRFIGASGDRYRDRSQYRERFEEDLTGNFSTAFINFALLFE